MSNLDSSTINHNTWPIKPSHGHYCARHLQKLVSIRYKIKIMYKFIKNDKSNLFFCFFGVCVLGLVNIGSGSTSWGKSYRKQKCSSQRTVITNDNPMAENWERAPSKLKIQDRPTRENHASTTQKQKIQFLHDYACPLQRNLIK